MKTYFNKLAMQFLMALALVAGLNFGVQQINDSYEAQLPQITFVGEAKADAMSNAWENSLIDFLLRGQSFTAPTTVYVALETAAGSDTGCGTEVSGGSYARVAVTSSLANWAGTQSSGSTAASSGTSGTTSNNAAITFPTPTANWGSVTGFCVMSASSGGTTFFRANLTTAKTVNNGDAAPSFAIGAATFQIDN
jgi:hypothetical protein